MTEIASYINDHVRLTLETNFDLDKWVHHFDVGQQEELIKKLKDVILKELEKRFKYGRSGNIPWEKKKPLTQAFEGGASRTLIFTGELSKSFEYTYTLNQLIVYTRKPYAKVHNFGAVFRTSPRQTYWMWVNLFERHGRIPDFYNIRIPKRTFMEFSDNLIADINSTIFEFCKKSENMGK